MPLEEGTFKIPEVKMVYFNPETGQYETSVAKGYTITVQKGKGSAKSQARKRLHFDSELQTVDIDRLHKVHRPVVYKGAYWLWFIIPTRFCCLALAYGYDTTGCIRIWPH